MTDELERFVRAQEPVYASALADLQRGRKRGHWMWFVFPQVAGLGLSPMAKTYAIGSLAEARAYLAHPLLAARLLECSRALMDVRSRSAEDVFGGIDAMKLRSSMTLFALAAPDEPVFPTVLDTWFDGRPDDATPLLLIKA